MQIRRLVSLFFALPLTSSSVAIVFCCIFYISCRHARELTHQTGQISHTNNTRTLSLAANLKLSQALGSRECSISAGSRNSYGPPPQPTCTSLCKRRARVIQCKQAFNLLIARTQRQSPALDIRAAIVSVNRNSFVGLPRCVIRLGVASSDNDSDRDITRECYATLGYM